MERPRRWLPVVGAAAVAAAYAWVVAGLRPFTWSALVSVAIAGVVAITFGTRHRRPSKSTHDRSGALTWGIVCALLAGWELAAYVQSPRADYPTLSVLADQLLDWRPARALAFLAWMAVGADLARR